jgi:hypothetical protein
LQQKNDTALVVAVLVCINRMVKRQAMIGFRAKAGFVRCACVTNRRDGYKAPIR